jgi:hypothetical protein
MRRDPVIVDLDLERQRRNLTQTLNLIQDTLVDRPLSGHGRWWEIEYPPPPPGTPSIFEDKKN